MLDKVGINHNEYIALMDEIKGLNISYKEIRKSKEYRVGRLLLTTGSCIKRLHLKELGKYYGRWINGTRSAKKFKNTAIINKKLDNIEPNYFSNERIAVYTVVFGNYDSIPEPFCKPDNVDYYMITDQKVDLSSSAWKILDISGFNEIFKGMTNVQKNRYLKMHPQVIFPNYKYSIYIDGNIQVVSDVTEYIYRIGAHDVSMHLHSSRSCVYEEAKAVIYAKKESKQAIDEHITHLRKEGFPEHYGMLECNIIARRHTKKMEDLMEDWWTEFCSHSKRDQLSFPYVLFKNAIAVTEVGTLGNNVHNNPSFRIYTHS